MTDRNMRAYFYGFHYTHADEIDAILEAVARAGKGHHHTEYWDDHDGDEPSYIDRIQTAANEAAAEIERLRAALEQHAIVRENVDPVADDDGTRWMCQLCCAGNGLKPTDLLHEESCLLYRADPSVERTKESE